MAKKNIDSIDNGKGFLYSDEVRRHFFDPQNFLKEDDWPQADGIGYVGSAACGDFMKIWVKIDRENDKIIECKWRTFGCGSAIAATSILSVIVTEKGGMKIDKALKIRPQDIIKRLKGLPSNKIHCSVLGDRALREAINDYFRNSKQYDRIIVGGGKMIDKVLKLTDQDLERAVLQGAKSFEQVQAMTKVGSGDPECLTLARKVVNDLLAKY